MNAIAKRTYALGWLFLVIAVIERLVMMFKESLVPLAQEHAVLPHNFLQLSFLFFVITIASGACCQQQKA